MMRIRRLDLDRFGHFTGQKLDFGAARAGTSDFHLVYGPNEAGKTTLMEAFLRLLYGFSHRGEDYAFLHQQDTLQVGGLLELGGREVHLTRIKRRANSLLDRDQQVLPESVLESVLGGLGLEDYRKLLCLDDSSIEKGGEEILKSEGDIGSLLFSAAAGVSGLSAVLAQTAAGAEAFYKKGGSKSEHAGLQKRLKEIAAEIRESDVSAPQYRKLLDEFERQKARENQLRGERDKAQTEERRLAALVEAHEIAAQLMEPRAELALIAHYPASIDIDPEQLIRIGETQAGLVQKQHGASVVIAALEGQLAGITVSPVVGLHADLEALEPLKGRAQGAVEDLPKRQDERVKLLADMAALVSALGVTCDDPQSLALPPHRIEALAQVRDALNEARLALETAAREDRDAGERLQTLVGELAAAGGGITGLPDISAILNSHDAERLAAETAKAVHAILQAEGAAREAMAELQVEGSSFSGLPAIALTPQEAAAHAQSISQALAAREHAAAEDAKARDNVRVAAARLAAFDAAGDLVDGETAAAGRAHRDALWQAHRASLDRHSADAFEAAMRESDRLADLRQAQAAQLAQLYQARLEVSEAEAKAENARRALDAAEAALAQLQAVHAARLQEAGLPTGFPANALADWLDKRSRARKAALALVEARNNAKPLETQADALRQALAFLPDVTAKTDIAILVRRALSLAKEQDALKAKFEAADRERNAKARREVQLKECEAREAECAARGQALLAEIFPSAAPRLVEAIPALQAIRELNGKVQELDERIVTMQRDLAAFEARMGELVANLAGYQGFAALECWRLLRREVDSAREAAAERARLEGRLSQALKDHEQATTRLEVMDREIGALAAVFPKEIAAGSLPQLRLAVTATLRAIELRRQVAQLQRQVTAKLGVGEIETALELLAQTPLHEAQDELARMRQLQREKQAELEAAISQRTSAETALSLVQGDDDVAELSAERRAIEARLEEGGVRYLEDRLGVMLAERALRRYRDTHRSGMLQSAEAAFAMLTHGVYSKLATQPASAGGETLIAIRERDGQSKLASQMSKGTRFQLYLALRAAAYEQLTGNGVVLPFFCDDIFETFDEDRTSAACSADAADRPARTGDLSHPPCPCGGNRAQGLRRCREHPHAAASYPCERRGLAERGQQRREIPAPCNIDSAKPKPLRHALQFAAQREGNGLRVAARFQMRGKHQQLAGGAVRLQVNAGGDLLAHQEGQHVIAMHALVRDRVDLQPHARTEQRLRTLALPDQRIERGKQRLRLDGARAAHTLRQIGRAIPSRDGDGDERALVHQFGDCRQRIGGLEPEIIAQALRGGNAQRIGRYCDECLVRLAFRRDRQCQDFRWQHFFGEIINPLE